MRPTIATLVVAAALALPVLAAAIVPDLDTNRATQLSNAFSSKRPLSHRKPGSSSVVRDALAAASSKGATASGKAVALEDAIISVPYFVYEPIGPSFPLIVVGSDPAKDVKKTFIKTTIIPINFAASVYATNGAYLGSTVFDATRIARKMARSPVFQNAVFNVSSKVGATQFGDAMMR
jgi:hypothetical protein